MKKNNDYTDVRIVDDIIYIRVYGIDTIFEKFIELCKMNMFYICNADNKDNLSVTFFSSSNMDTLSLFYSDDKLITKYIISYKQIDLKPEVGYEIINKLLEIYGDELYEK